MKLFSIVFGLLIICGVAVWVGAKLKKISQDLDDWNDDEPLVF